MTDCLKGFAGLDSVLWTVKNVIKEFGLMEAAHKCIQHTQAPTTTAFFDIKSTISVFRY